MASDYQVIQTTATGTLNSSKCENKSDSEYFRDQLAMMKENFLNPAEVKFKIQDESVKKLRRFSSSSSDAVSISSSTTSKEKRKIPDGGYGWVIVFASLMVSLIADGISFSFGLLYTEFLNYFQESPTKTAWIGSLFLAVPLISGPLMSNLVDRYGCQKMTMIGGILGCVGFMMSALSNSVEMLCITFGVIAGLGLGVIYVTAVVSIAFWFETKRTFAIGIGASGTGIGTFIYAPFTQWLISYYGWRGATLILGGTLFNFSVFGALMIDPDWLIEENKLESRSQSIQTISNSSIALDEIKKLIETGAPKEDLLDTLVTNLNTEANQQIQDPEIDSSKKFQSEILLPTFIYSQGLKGGTGKSTSRNSLSPRFKETELIMTESQGDEVFYESFEKNRRKSSDFPNYPKIIVTEVSSGANLAVYGSGSGVMIPISNFNPAQDNNDSSYLESEDQFDENQAMEVHRSGVHGSRLSFNENILMKPSSVEDFKEAAKRRNTLDVTGNSGLLSKNIYITIPSKRKIDNPYQPTTVAQKTALRSRHQARRQTHLNPVGNLKNIQSLKYSNYLKNMKFHRHHHGSLVHPHKHRLKASSCPNIYRNSMATNEKEENETWYGGFVEFIKDICDVSLFWEYKFGMMSLSTLFLYAWYIIPYFYINEFVLGHGYTEQQGAYLISIIGIFNTIGMIGLGWVGDQPWCNVTKTYGFCMFLCGVSILLIPLATWSYVLLLILCAIFGITFGSSFSFTPMITSRLVDMDDFTVAYGLILLVQGIGSLVGPPLAGWIFDITNRWDDSFYIGGVFVALSGFLGYIIGDLQMKSDGDEESN